MDNKWKVLIGIIIAAIFLGAEQAARIMGVSTYNIGYIAAGISFLGAILLGARR